MTKTLLSILFPLVVGAVLIYGVVKIKPEFLGFPKVGSSQLSEDDVLIEAVGRLVTLPVDEKPSVATITDVKKVLGQDFYKNALNGDKVIIFVGIKKAILYRPSENKIVDVGVVSINEPIKPVISPLPSVVASTSPTTTPKTTIKPTASAISSATPKPTPVFNY